MRFGYCQVRFEAFEQALIKKGIEYASKAIEPSHMINMDLSQAYLYFSKSRDVVTPEQLANFRVAPSAANTIALPSKVMTMAA